MDGGIRIFGAFSNIDMDKRIQGADIKKGKENNFARPEAGRKEEGRRKEGRGETAGEEQ